MNQKGFSLVELMVCVAILGVLAMLSVPSYEAMMDKSRYGRAKADMGAIRVSAMALRASVDNDLMTAMGSVSTAAFFQGRTTNAIPVCASPMKALPQWQKLSIEDAPFDPWGQCYLFDENENENGKKDCRFDVIISGGKDQMWSGSGDGDDVYDDDTIMRIPWYFEHPDCKSTNIEGQFGG